MGRRSHHITFQCFPPLLFLLMFRNSLFQRQIQNYPCKQDFWLIYSEQLLLASQKLTCYILSFHFLPIWVFTSHHVALLSQESMESISSLIEEATQLPTTNLQYIVFILLVNHMITVLSKYFSELNFSLLSTVTAVFTTFSTQVCTWRSFQLAKSR